MSETVVIEEHEEDSYKIFDAGITNDITREYYITRMEDFMKFCNAASYDELASYDRKKAQNKIRFYIQDLKERVNPNSIPGRISAPILFFTMQDEFVLNIKLIRKALPRTIKRDGAFPYKMEDIQKILASAKSHRDRAIVSFLASTGVRPAVITELKIKDLTSDHLTEVDKGVQVTPLNSITIYAKDKEEYVVFLTPEAKRYLDIYIENRKANNEIITPNSPVFRSRYIRKKGYLTVVPISYGALKVTMYDMVQEAKIRTRFKNSNKRHEVALFGGFRKHFSSVLNNNKETNPNINEKHLGHKNNLQGVYFNPTTKERYDNFKLAIADLTISDKKRDAIKIKELESKETSMSQMKEDVTKYKKSYDEFTKLSNDREFQLKTLGPMLERIEKRIKAEIIKEMSKK